MRSGQGKVAKKESREARLKRNDEAHAAIARVASKARGHYADEIKKLSPKAQARFEEARAYAVTPKKLRQFQKRARIAWKALSKAERIKIRRKYKARREFFSESDWFHKITEGARVSPDRASNADADTSSRRARRAPQKEGRAHRTGKQTPVVTVTIDQRGKRLDKAIRRELKMPTPPKNPYAALMQPMAIVPDDPQGKIVVADAGSVVWLADQAILYRNRVSPITRRADEILVHYGSAKTPTLGWLTNMLGAKAMKPSKGPTFLVKTRNEDALIAWERWRLKVARARVKDSAQWIAPWLAHHGAKIPQELREVTRLFGGKLIKNESTDVRITRLFTHILKTELDMATAKRMKSKKAKASKKIARAEKSKATKGKTAKASRVSTDRITTKHDEHIIKRLVKENPRRAGSAKAKIWDKLKKGMTVGTFVEKGGSRASVGRYIKNGWIKLIRPASGDE